MHSAEEKRTLTLPKIAFVAIEGHCSNAIPAGCLKRDYKIPSRSLGGKTAMKILQFGQILLLGKVFPMFSQA